MPKSHIAIFIDAENIGARHWPEIKARAASLGIVNSCRVFGDFTEDRMGKWLDVARKEGLQAVLQLSGGKNATDIAIVISAMDTLHAGRTQTIFLASSDQDFAPLALRLRAGGVRVCGFGLSNAAESLRVACTEFIELGASPEHLTLRSA